MNSYSPLFSSRDLKPDNILLDAEGHAHLTDFNVAIHYSERRLHTSVAGSMAYMAPEIFARKGYTWCVDWWSLGVVAWELFFHRRPFDHRTSSRMQNAILNDPIRIPPAVTKEGKEGSSARPTSSSGSGGTPVACSPDAQSFILGVRPRPLSLIP